MGDSNESSRSRRLQGLSTSLYRPSRLLSTPKAPTDPIACEILRARHQQSLNRKKVLAARNRIRMLETMQQQTQRTAKLQRRNEAFLTEIRERRRQEEALKEKVRAQRQAEELDSRIRLLRDKYERSALVSTARSRVLSEKRGTVEEIKRMSELLDEEIESRREQERLRNVDRRRAIFYESSKRRQERTLSAQSQREMLKEQYRKRLELEQQKAEEEAQRLSSLKQELAGRTAPSQQQSVD